MFRVRRLILLTLMVAALAVRGMAPAGWMPGTNAAGGIALTLCNGMGGETVILTADGRIEHKQADHGRADHPCAFAGLSVVDTAPPAVTVAAVPVVDRATPPARPYAWTTPGRGLAAPPPPPTGPPAFA